MAGKPITKRIVSPNQIDGELIVPGDKSISHRAIIFNSLARDDSIISNISMGRDCLSTITCLKSLGVKFSRLEQGQEPLIVHGVGDAGLTEPENILNAGNSGTTMRLFGGMLVAQHFLSILTGDTSLRSRPMKRLIDPLRLMGAEIYGRDGDSFAPLVIRGKKIKGIDYTLPIPSAQIKSAILLAGLFASGSTTIKQPQLSRDHTERLLKQMGAKLETDGVNICLTPLTSPLAPVDMHVPGDISSAAYWLVAGVIHPNARIKIKHCGINPTRTGIIDVLLAMGANLEIENQYFEGNEPVADICVESSSLRGVKIDGELIPRLVDEIPVLAVAACIAEGSTVIKDAAELRVKESDRIMTTVSELSRLGARIEELPDGMIIHGGKPLMGAEVKSHADHRLAMSLAIAGLVSKGETIIHNARAIEISYPLFWEELEKITKYKN